MDLTRRLLYVCDWSGLRRVDLDTRIVDTLVRRVKDNKQVCDGSFAQVHLQTPMDVVMDSKGRLLMLDGSYIRVLDLEQERVDTIPLPACMENETWYKMTFDASNRLYLGNHHAIVCYSLDQPGMSTFVVLHGMTDPRFAEDPETYHARQIAFPHAWKSNCLIWLCKINKKMVICMALVGVGYLELF